MLPLELIRREPDRVRHAARLKGETAPIDEILTLDEEWRGHLHKAETIKAEQNTLSKEFAKTRDEELKERLREMADRSKAELAEAGIVVVVAGESWMRRRKRDAVFIDGIAWRSSTPWYEGGAVEHAEYAKRVFEAAKRQAGMKGQLSSFDLVEADDTYSYKLLQHLASLEGSEKGVTELVRGRRGGGGRPYVNASGGSLGVGYLIEATGLHKILECVLQMRNEAGGNQVKGVERALALSWRGNPTATGAVAILSR